MKRALSVAAVTAFIFLLTPVSAMAADGTLQGRVTHDGGGVANACIDVHRAGDTLSRTVVRADGTGRYSESFAPGQYVLRFSDCSTGNFAQEWYNDKPSFAEADVVTVTSGGSTTANARLAPAAKISGKVTNAGGTGLANICVTAQDPDRLLTRSTTKTSSSGNFVVGGLPTGNFVVSARDCERNPAQYATAWYSGTSTPARGADQGLRVAASSGQTSPLAETLRLPAAGTLSGTVTPQAAGICVSAIDVDSNTTAGTTTNTAGAWTISGLLPGNWYVKVFDCRDRSEASKLATAFIGSGGSTPNPAAAEGDPIEVTSGANAIGNTVLRSGGALTGALRVAENADELRTPNSAGTAIANACVGVTAPGSLDIIRAVRTSSGGASFTIGGLDPALAYRVVAYNCGNGSKFGLEWHSDSLLAFQSDGVGITAGQTADIGNLEVGQLVRRAAGQDRRLTASALALGGWTTSDHVVLASEAVYADALAGAPFAALVNAPLLLVDGKGLTPDVRDTINALGAKYAWILGGPATITLAMEGQLGQQTSIEAVERIGGPTRFHTAQLIANRMAPSVDTSRAYVVEGNHALQTRGWPDAMSVAGLAAFEQVPLLLVTANEYPEPTKQALTELGVAHVDIVGGPVAVSDAVKDQIDGDVGTVNRISGADRFGTSMAVVDTALSRGAWSRTVWIASGSKFPDSLVGGAAVAQDGGLLMLAAGDDINNSTATALKLADLSLGIDRVIILGGEATISPTVANQIVGLVD